MKTNVTEVLCPPVLRPGGIRVTATPRGISRVELKERLPPSIVVEGRRLEAGGGGDGLAQARAWLARALSEFEAYFELRTKEFRTPVDLDGQGSSFQRRVWHLLGRIGYGETCTYGELAARLGMRGGARAVGGAVGRNPIPIILPCHRVVGSGGHLTGFSAGLKLKVKLLRLEGHDLDERPQDDLRRLRI